MHSYFRQNNKSSEGYCLKLDIRKFFDSIPKSVLYAVCQKKIKDKLMCQFVKNVISTFPNSQYSDQKWGRRRINTWMSNFSITCIGSFRPIRSLFEIET